MMFSKKILSLSLATMLSLTFVSCKDDDGNKRSISDIAKTVQDVAKDVVSGQVALKDANAIRFLSDTSIVTVWNTILGPEDNPLNNLDNASLFWTWGTFLFAKKYDNTDFYFPVLSDSQDSATTYPVHVKIELGGDGYRKGITRPGPIVIYDKDIEVSLIQFSEYFTAEVQVGGTVYNLTEIPRQAPIPITLQGKTVTPAYFLITADDFDWSKMGSSDKKGEFKEAIRNQDKAALQTLLTGDLPLPWFCETVKMTVSYIQSDGSTIEGVKYLMADPQFVINLLQGLLAKGAEKVDALLLEKGMEVNVAGMIEPFTEWAPDRSCSDFAMENNDGKPRDQVYYDKLWAQPEQTDPSVVDDATTNPDETTPVDAATEPDSQIPSKY